MEETFFFETPSDPSPFIHFLSQLRFVLDVYGVHTPFGPGVPDDPLPSPAALGFSCLCFLCVVPGLSPRNFFLFLSNSAYYPSSHQQIGFNVSPVFFVSVYFVFLNPSTLS